MLARTSGIVIKTTKYSESSVIAKIYTESHGMLTFHVPGVHGKKSGIKPSFLQPMQLLDINFYYNDNKNFQKIKELRSELKNNSIQFDVHKSSLAMVLSELIFKCIKEEEHNQEMFGFIKEQLLLLDEGPKIQPGFLLYFLLHFTRFLGFYPSNSFSPEKAFFDLENGQFVSAKSLGVSYIEPPESQWFGSIIDARTARVNVMKINPEHRQLIIEKLLLYYKIHVTNFTGLKSYNILLGILKS